MPTLEEVRSWQLAFERGELNGRKWNPRGKEMQPINPYLAGTRPAQEWNNGFRRGQEERERRRAK